MADITDPRALQFTNELRATCERLWDMMNETTSIEHQWNGEVSPFFAVGTDDVQDGRENEGISRLKASDVTNVITQVQNIKAVLTAAGVDVVLDKLRVNRT